jgi:uncharacterized protein (TIGR00255 family)
MKSMTGFGRAAVEQGGRTCTVEIRTVNHRYCEIALRLPHAIQGLEPDVRQSLQKRFPRGSISVTILLDGREDDLGTLVINTAVARRYIDLLRELKRAHGLAGEVDVNTVALLPDLFGHDQGELEEKQFWPVIAEALELAAARVDQNRLEEGKHIEREFRTRIGRMIELVGQLEGRAPDRARELKGRLRTRLGDLVSESGVDPARLAQELAILADRIDYTEECVRLRAHTQQYLDIMASEGPLGRRLNFIVQEMGREANTIGSKANDPFVSGVVVEIKEEIEKLREQVQNIE